MERKGITFLLWCCGMVAGFQTRQTFTPRYAVTTVDDNGGTALQMAKKIHNKQAELAKKLALAKEQNALKEGVDTPDARGGTERLSDAAIKERNDRLRFEELLKKQAASLNDISLDGYLSKQQEDAEIDAYQRGLDRIFEGDTAPTQPFEELVNIKSENAIGDTGMRRLVPWLKNTKTDYLIIVCDPRMQSPELRETVLQLNVGLPDELLNKLIVINADTPAENRRWLKKGNLDNMTVFSDEKRQWMRAYTALGEDRWSMTMFVIADERVQKIAREMESLSAVKVIQNAVKAMKERQL